MIGAEDIIALGSLIALSLWLFVGLPVLYWFWALDQQHQIEFMIWILPSFIGFLGGSLATWALSRFYEHRNRPILSARLVEGFGCYVTTSRGNPATHTARFLRLLIENRGRATVQNCKGYITAITQIVNGTRTPVQQEVLELLWSSAASAAPRSIPRGAFFYMDIASLDVIPQNSVLGLSVLWLPNHFVGLLQPAATATLELQIKIAADNAAPVDRTVRFDFDAQWHDLRFQYD